MEPEGSLPHSQELANCPYSEPDQSSPRRPNISNTENIQNQDLVRYNNLFNKLTTRVAMWLPLSKHMAETNRAKYIRDIKISIDYRDSRRCNKQKQK